jgi:hypothetical protein
MTARFGPPRKGRVLYGCFRWRRVGRERQCEIGINTAQARTKKKVQRIFLHELLHALREADKDHRRVLDKFLEMFRDSQIAGYIAADIRTQYAEECWDEEIAVETLCFFILHAQDWKPEDIFI